MTHDCSVFQEKQPHGLLSQTLPLTEFISTELLEALGLDSSSENNSSEAGARAPRMQSCGHGSGRRLTHHNSAFLLFTFPSCPIYFLPCALRDLKSVTALSWFSYECLFKNLDPLHANKVELRLIVTRVVGFSENCNCEFVTGRDR